MCVCFVFCVLWRCGMVSWDGIEDWGLKLYVGRYVVEGGCSWRV